MIYWANAILLQTATMIITMIGCVRVRRTRSPRYKDTGIYGVDILAGRSAHVTRDIASRNTLELTSRYTETSPYSRILPDHRPPYNPNE
mmetsp:Transcript_27431/g.43335  ORF Transcript_27431/g.43335 Transcript_27431/m.43335 type:complete len:89 (+) Transcript_27431:286-552(+)